MNRLLEQLLGFIGSFLPVSRPEFRIPRNGAQRLYLTRGIYNIKDDKDAELIANELKGASYNHKSKTLDLGGNILSGKKLKGDGSDNEEQDPLLRINLQGLTIKNGFCESVKDGIHISADGVTLYGMHWLDVGEDAVSTKRGVARAHIENCSFCNDKENGDKSIQLNGAKDALVKGCIIYKGVTGIRLGVDEDPAGQYARVINTQFVGCNTAINALKLTVQVSNCTYRGVRKKAVLGGGARVL